MPSSRLCQTILGKAHQGRKILVSGALFSLLGLGGAVLSLLALPVLRLLPGGPEGLRRRAGGLIHRCFRLFVFALEGSGILRVEASGLPGPRELEGTLVVSNHPSYLDVVVLIALLPNAVCVVKEAIWNSPFFGRLVRAAGYIPISGSEEVLEAGREALRSGKILIIFPEGTRSRPGQPVKFQRGAAYLAQSTGRILPLVLTCAPALLVKGHRWYHIPVETCRFRVRAGDPPFDPSPQASSTPHLAARQLIEALENYYNKETYVADEGRNPC